MATGLFPIRQERGGPRPYSRFAIKHREDAIDDQVAEALSDGLSLDQVAQALRCGRGRIDASFRRIRMKLGGQAI